MLRDAKPEAGVPARLAAWGGRAAEKNRPQALPVRAVCRPIALSKAEVAALSNRQHPGDPAETALPLPAGLRCQRHEPCDVLRGELSAGIGCEVINAGETEILVEVAADRRQHDRLDPNRARSFY